MNYFRISENIFPKFSGTVTKLSCHGAYLVDKFNGLLTNDARRFDRGQYKIVSFGHQILLFFLNLFFLFCWRAIDPDEIADTVRLLFAENSP